MTHGTPGLPTDRPLRDLGALVVLVTARPLLRYYHRGERRDGLPLTTLADLRRQARRFPETGAEFAAASMARSFAWAFVLVAGLVGYVTTALVRNWTGAGSHPLPVTIMTGVAAVGMFAGGALMASGARWSLAAWREERLDHLLAERAGPVRPRPGLLLRLCTPSHGDMIFALLWSLWLTPALYGVIVEPV